MIALKIVTLKEKNILRNLFSYFIHDLAQYEHVRVDKNGFFNCPDLDFIIKHRGLYSYLIFYKNELAGFIVISRPPYFSKDKKTSCIQQLFILNGFRRKGLGSVAILKILKKFPGKYSFFQLLKNRPAIKLCREFLKRNEIKYLEKKELVGTEEMLIQRFNL